MKRAMILVSGFMLVIAALWFFGILDISGKRVQDQSRLTSQNQIKTEKSMVEVKTPKLASIEKAGEAIFNGKCQQCHGTSASGKHGSGPPLIHIYYEPNHHSDAAFYMAVAQGVRAHHWPFGDMPPVAGVSHNDTTKIIAYIRALQRENGIY